MGDHCQLPPTICSEVAKAEGLETSFFERMVMQGIQPVLLDTQYPEFLGARGWGGGGEGDGLGIEASEPHTADGPFSIFIDAGRSDQGLM